MAQQVLGRVAEELRLESCDVSAYRNHRDARTARRRTPTRDDLNQDRSRKVVPHTLMLRLTAATISIRPATERCLLC